MYSLINNSCVSRIEFDSNSGNNFGKIFFVDGEIYTGEIFDDSPKGIGNLHLKDISSFQGSFNGKTMQQGTFNHFAGVRYEGTFKKDKFHKGTLIFKNNQKLIGEWGLKKGKWILLKGLLKEHNGNTLCDFQEDREYKHKREKFTIIKNHDSLGFVIFFEQIQIQNKSFKNFMMTAQNLCSWEFQKLGKIYKREINYSKIPYSRIQIKDTENYLDHNIKFGFGISLEIDEENTLKFNSLKNIKGKGEYKLNKTFSFEGILYNNSQEIGFIEIFKNSFNPIKIVFNNQKFKSIQKFEEFLIQNFSCAKIQKIEKEVSNKIDNIQKQCIDNVINDIKEHEQCTIFQLIQIII